MKQKFLVIPWIFFFAITLIIASCSKGPAGPQGATGATGATGSQGPAGPTGTANVIYSDWLDSVTFKGTDTTGWVAEISAPKLVDSILNKGTIKVYFNAGSDSANSDLVLPLPLDGGLGVTAEVIYQPHLITIVANFDISSFTLNGYHHFQYRYVLIPGGITALPTSIYGNKSTINWNNYNEVKNYLGLKN